MLLSEVMNWNINTFEKEKKCQIMKKLAWNLIFQKRAGTHRNLEKSHIL